MDEEEIQITDVEDVDPEILQEATSMGWVPKDKFKGPEDRWVDAETFVEKGRHVVPIMQANNKRLQKDLLTRDQKIDTLTQQLTETREQLDKLEVHWTEANKRAVVQAKKDLLDSLKNAREEGDLEAEQAILGQLDDIRVSEKEQKEKKEKPEDKSKAKPYTENLDADTQAFLADNDWYGVDKKRTKAYNRLAEDMRDDGVTTVGRAFMDEVLEKLESQEQELPDGKRPTSKVENGNSRSGARGGSGSFASLPADAKKACHEDMDTLVGPNKKFKTPKEWEDYYAKMYYSQET